MFKNKNDKKSERKRSGWKVDDDVDNAVGMSIVLIPLKIASVRVSFEFANAFNLCFNFSNVFSSRLVLIAVMVEIGGDIFSDAWQVSLLLPLLLQSHLPSQIKMWRQK